LYLILGLAAHIRSVPAQFAIVEIMAAVTGRVIPGPLKVNIFEIFLQLALLVFDFSTNCNIRRLDDEN
jgi:hypothetical protein